MRIDVHRLLEARESDECVAFRQWLQGLDEASDQEVAERVTSLRARLGAAVRGGSARVARFLTVTGIGLVPGLGQGVAVSVAAADAFLLERVLRTNGPATFLSQLYPRIIKNTGDSGVENR